MVTLKIPSRFTIAIHILACVHYFQEEFPVTSEFLSGSIRVNAVIVRQILLMLKRAGMLRIMKGRGGIYLAKDVDDITLYDVFDAVEAVDGELFRFHENPNPECPVGKKIHEALDDNLNKIQTALYDKMKQIKISDITAITEKKG